MEARCDRVTADELRHELTQHVVVAENTLTQALVTAAVAAIIGVLDGPLWIIVVSIVAAVYLQWGAYCLRWKSKQIREALDLLKD